MPVWTKECECLCACDGTTVMAVRIATAEPQVRLSGASGDWQTRRVGRRQGGGQRREGYGQAARVESRGLQWRPVLAAAPPNLGYASYLRTALAQGPSNDMRKPCCEEAERMGMGRQGCKRCASRNNPASQPKPGGSQHVSQSYGSAWS